MDPLLPSEPVLRLIHHPTGGEFAIVSGAMTELTRTRTSVYLRSSDGIITQRILPGIVKQTLLDAQENVEAFTRIAAGKKQLLLVDMREPFSTEKGVREHYASPAAALWLERMAMLTPSQTGRIIGNFFLSLNAPSFPCRLFSDEPSAVRWLLTRAQ